MKIVKKFIYFVVIQLAIITSLLAFITPAKAANNLADCVLGITFFTNGQEYQNKPVLINPKSIYTLQVGVGFLSNATCQPRIYWKATSNGALVESGNIPNNIDFTKNIKLGSAAPKEYTYTFTIAEDAGFTTDVHSKSIKVLFTQDPKITGPGSDPKNPSADVPPTGGTVNSGVTVKPGQSFDTILGTFFNPLEFTSITELIVRLINIGLLFAAMIAVIVIISGGFNLVTAMGNETKITKGKKSIMWAIAGLVVCLLSFSIVAIIQKVIS